MSWGFLRFQMENDYRDASGLFHKLSHPALSHLVFPHFIIPIVLLNVISLEEAPYKWGHYIKMFLLYFAIWHVRIQEDVFIVLSRILFKNWKGDIYASMSIFSKYDCREHSPESHFLFIVGLLQRELEQLQV